MKIAQRLAKMLPAFAASWLVACGGGSSGDGGGNSTAGIDRGGITIAQGPVSGFGSVIVNGVHYATSGASILIDDRPGTEAELRVGQVVRIEGTVDANGTTGTARSIVFDDELEGVVQSIDLAGSRFAVLGQTVQVGTPTSFDDSIVPRGIDGLLVGMRIEVSGFVAADGVILATRVERKSDAASVEVKGTVESVDATARRLRIGQLQVDYSTAMLSGFASGQPAPGDRVETVGALDAAGVLVASRLERLSADLSGTSSDRADLEGLVTRYASATDFDVAGQRVTTTAATRYEGGTAASLALDVNVEVEGGFDGSGRIVATEIEFRRQSELELTGRVDALDVAAGRLVVLGATVRTTSITRFEDHSSAGLEYFGLDDLRIGDYVEIRAYRDGGDLVATLLERDDPETDVELQGLATDVVPPDFRVAGIGVTTDANTEFRNKDGASITADAFFAAAPGRKVKVRGALVGSTVLALRAELED